MLFNDRAEAGVKLAAALQKYYCMPNTIIVGLARGGVVVAAKMAQLLKVPLDVTCPRKIGAPQNKEYAIGAVTEAGKVYLNAAAIRALSLSQKKLDEIIAKEIETAKIRLKTFRKGWPERDLSGKNVIIVDDGIATGYTIKAAIATVKQERAEKVIIAVPVSSSESREQIKTEVDEFFCLYNPSRFQAVGEFYRNFTQVDDVEVVSLLNLTCHL